MPVRIDLNQIAFGQPEMLLAARGAGAAPRALGLAALRAACRTRPAARTHGACARAVRAARRPAVLAVPDPLVVFLILALARPHGPATAVRAGGVDVVILQDGSASMYVKDVGGSRWNRSIRFLRILGDSLSWNSDRIAMALFAHIAAPQVRLTKDPNTFFFFVDHLDATLSLPHRG